ncbi:MAG: coenzyme A pyrophosphatase [Thalassobius sp.]|nr:coenzyme A pyrophosphatase [Thalassovita sp.]
MIKNLEIFLREKLQGDLPGYEAHAQMTENMRLRKMQQQKSTPRKAGVLILIYHQNNQFHIPFILRPVYQGVHSGQMAFPGGRYEKGDKDLVQTAIRETWEEIGVQIDRSKIVGSLSDLYIPPSNSLVTPTVAVTYEKPSYTPDPREVDKVFDFPIHSFVTEENRKQVKIKLQNGVHIKTPGFVINNQVIWGATAMIMNELLHVLEDFMND